MVNFSDPASPIFMGGYGTETLINPAMIKVVTWNIKFSQEIETAIEELGSVPELRDAGLLLLQEMDEDGVEEIAHALAYNYVYFPASIHSRHGRNFGNAVLSKWPLRNASKVLLPHANPKNGQRRIAAQATVTIDGVDIVVYSVHTETLWLAGRQRTEQAERLLMEQAEHLGPAIVGGDFNTLTPANSEALVDAFAGIGFQHVSADTGPTFKAVGLGFTSDHLFARELPTIAAGVWSETEASDHFPLWAILSLSQSTTAGRAVHSPPLR